MTRPQLTCTIARSGLRTGIFPDLAINRSLDLPHAHFWQVRAQARRTSMPRASSWKGCGNRAWPPDQSSEFGHSLRTIGTKPMRSTLLQHDRYICGRSGRPFLELLGEMASMHCRMTSLLDIWSRIHPKPQLLPPPSLLTETSPNIKLRFCPPVRATNPLPLIQRPSRPSSLRLGKSWSLRRPRINNGTINRQVRRSRSIDFSLASCAKP